MVSGQSTSPGGPAAAPDGATPDGATPDGAAPRCEHLDGLVPTGPESADCRGCRRQQALQTSLVFCLTCGWVACSDGSPNQHARAHYEETDHPVVASFALGESWRWCYVHQRLV